MNVTETTHAETKSTVAEDREISTLRRDIPPAIDRTYKLGDGVLVYNGEKKEWFSPLIVVYCAETMITLYNLETILTILHCLLNRIVLYRYKLNYIFILFKK